MQQTPKLSIVVPAFKEEPVIGASLQSLANYLKEVGLNDNTEVIVVAADGGDNTASIARSLSPRFSHLKVIEPGPKVGKGRDVKVGVEAARGRYIIFTDADMATPPHHIADALAQLESGAALVIGVRHLWHIHEGLGRKLNSVVANWLVRLVLLPLIPDSQCGFKGFTSQSAHTVFSKMTIQGWAFDMELLVIAKTHRMRIDKLVIADWSDPKQHDEGLVGESAWQAGLQTLKELVKICKQRVAGMYKP